MVLLWAGKSRLLLELPYSSTLAPGCTTGASEMGIPGSFDRMAGAQIVIRCCWRSVGSKGGMVQQMLHGLFNAQEINVADQNTIPSTLVQPKTNPILIGFVSGPATLRVLIQLHTSLEAAFQV